MAAPTQPCEQTIPIAALSERVHSLERWENQQNGSLRRIEEKLDKLEERFDKKYESLRNWLLGALGTCALSLLVQFLSRR